MAALYLKDTGYRIFARNYRIAAGEIDLIVGKDGYLIFVEVKYRSNSRYGSPEAAVTTFTGTPVSSVYFLASSCQAASASGLKLR